MCLAFSSIWYQNEINIIVNFNGFELLLVCHKQQREITLLQSQIYFLKYFLLYYFVFVSL